MGYHFGYKKSSDKNSNNKPEITRIDNSCKVPSINTGLQQTEIGYIKILKNGITTDVTCMYREKNKKCGVNDSTCIHFL